MQDSETFGGLIDTMEVCDEFGHILTGINLITSHVM